MHFLHNPSCSVDGEVRVWDIRQARGPLVSFSAFPAPMQMSAMAVHESAGLVAAYVASPFPLPFQP